MNPYDTPALFNLSMTYSQNKDFPSAINSLKKALSVDPHFQEERTQLLATALVLAREYQQQKYYDQASALLSSILEKKHNYAIEELNRGNPVFSLQLILTGNSW